MRLQPASGQSRRNIVRLPGGSGRAQSSEILHHRLKSMSVTPIVSPSAAASAPLHHVDVALVDLNGNELTEPRREDADPAGPNSVLVYTLETESKVTVGDDLNLVPELEPRSLLVVDREHVVGQCHAQEALQRQVNRRAAGDRDEAEQAEIFPHLLKPQPGVGDDQDEQVARERRIEPRHNAAASHARDLMLEEVIVEIEASQLLASAGLGMRYGAKEQPSQRLASCPRPHPLGRSRETRLNRKDYPSSKKHKRGQWDCPKG